MRLILHHYLARTASRTEADTPKKIRIIPGLWRFKYLF